MGTGRRPWGQGGRPWRRRAHPPLPCFQARHALALLVGFQLQMGITFKGGCHCALASEAGASPWHRALAGHCV